MFFVAEMMIAEWEQNYELLNAERHFAHIEKFSLYRPWLEQLIVQWQEATESEMTRCRAF